ncbi:hypothetical protein COHA_006632 [Chlorella ohadii]|uniref:Nuclear speckle splicing regulatory protein 1 N-terminal domain-containing protein n=1 Tax=Chlorella ohadii TaxID=2649997 RepID=A0AAD5DNJ4_9CHLO|nr:hypothetical protein COHA_006632 [Chlorella ohadii]
MITGQKGVKYGLEVRKPPGAKAAAPAPSKRSVFGDDDSDEEQQGNVEQQIARQAARKQTDKKVADLHAAALAEDAAIFDYDSHYDAIQASRAEPKKQEKLQRQSRYIAGLLEKAEERKREQDILYERQLAKERAAEDHLYGDKEKFVTSAYRAKLAERQAYQEEQKRKKQEEEANAVEKKGHMGDFYRNLLRSNVAFGAKPSTDEKPAAGGAPAGAAAAAGKQQQQQRREGEQGAEEEPEEPQWLPRDQSPDAAAAQQQRQEEREAGQRSAGEGEPAGWEAAQAALQARKGAAAGPADEREQGDEPRQQPRQQPQEGAAAARAEGGPGAAEAGAASGPAAEAGARRNKEDAVAAARERFLARKKQRTV